MTEDPKAQPAADTASQAAPESEAPYKTEEPISIIVKKPQSDIYAREHGATDVAPNLEIQNFSVESHVILKKVSDPLLFLPLMPSLPPSSDSKAAAHLQPAPSQPTSVQSSSSADKVSSDAFESCRINGPEASLLDRLSPLVRRSFHKEATTLLYRAPEQLFKVSKGYNEKADHWGLGCILLELILGRPFFAIAKNAESLETLLTKIFGEKAFLDVPEICASQEFQKCDKSWKMENFEAFLKMMNLDADTIDLLLKLMDLNPSKRPQLSELVDHPFFHVLKGLSQA